MNSAGKIGPPTNPLRLADGEGEHLGDHDGGEQAHAERPAVVEHGLELIAAGEHRQRQATPTTPNTTPPMSGRRWPGP